MFRRVVTYADLEAFKYCGFDLATDYRALAPKQETMGFMVYVPVSEDEGSEMSSVQDTHGASPARFYRRAGAQRIGERARSAQAIRRVLGPPARVRLRARLDRRRLDGRHGRPIDGARARGKPRDRHTALTKLRVALRDLGPGLPVVRATARSSSAPISRSRRRSLPTS